MSKFTESDIHYRGESNGVHKWEASNGQPYYWHPDWLHVAEDETGLHPKEKLNITDTIPPSKEHAVSAVVRHLNDWFKEQLDQHPDIETQAIESEIDLKK
ncbi:hypothetical protein BCU70_11120 [Vibrio sp. 10N.286.49.C2]|uniref:hypothetical protein n=1 Tax=unclassified Vibrio TaxID=2614977 RepID=UPI000C82A561|nr:MULTISPECIES: hypothetical protein [unclassified Vibrio]PMH40766.1 hypothetical protein BCU70_11120 [Vibrio sp. 10N.286.49.C2]PMH45301.1 hypothetical protein BCU66_02720 [Vibrio sp. 10N.286.49.B1]PMH78283.1 hypothetical protein BCU58_09780 [Vibrio sp. 10N.286.48.B7]